jgi:hypothetical protein
MHPPDKPGKWQNYQNETQIKRRIPIMQINVRRGRLQTPGKQTNAKKCASQTCLHLFAFFGFAISPTGHLLAYLGCVVVAAFTSWPFVQLAPAFWSDAHTNVMVMIYTFIGFGDIQGPKPYRFIGTRDIHGPQPYQNFGIRWAFIPHNLFPQQQEPYGLP